MNTQTKTLSVRIKDKHAAVLRQMAFEVNQVFNLANEITSAAYSNAGAFGPQKPQWLSAFDVQKMTAGIQKERGYSIGSAGASVVALAVRWAGFRLNPVQPNGKAVALSSPDTTSKYGIATA